MSENENKVEVPVAPVGVLVHAATAVESLSAAEKVWILRAAAKIQEAEQKAADDKAAADLKAKQDAQTLEARQERQKAAQK